MNQICCTRHNSTSHTACDGTRSSHFYTEPSMTHDLHTNFLYSYKVSNGNHFGQNLFDITNNVLNEIFICVTDQTDCISIAYRLIICLIFYECFDLNSPTSRCALITTNIFLAGFNNVSLSSALNDNVRAKVVAALETAIQPDGQIYTLLNQ